MFGRVLRRSRHHRDRARPRGPVATAHAGLFSRNIEEAPANLISLTYNDAAGEDNQLAFAHEGNEVVARESSAQLRQENCAGGPVESRCDATGVESFLIDTGAGTDEVEVGLLGTLPFGTDVQLGAGNDRVTIGAAAKIKADGDTGDDVLTGGPLADDLTGGEGDDRILGGDGADQIATGGGRDVAEGGAGNDTIYGSGQGVDRISCGAGEDKVFAEPRDVIAPDCESGRTVLIRRPSSSWRRSGRTGASSSRWAPRPSASAWSSGSAPTRRRAKARASRSAP